MINCTSSIKIKKKKKENELDYTIIEALNKYKNRSCLNKNSINRNYNDLDTKVDIQEFEKIEKNIVHENLSRIKDIEENNFTFNNEKEKKKYLNFNLHIPKDSLKDNIKIKLQHFINEYIYCGKEKKINEILNSKNKKQLLKKYVYELKKNNFEILENLYFFFSIDNNYNDYALNKIFHSLLLVFDKNEEKNILIALYFFLILLNDKNINKYFTYIIDCLHNILNADQSILQIDEIDENLRLFDHKPMILKNYFVNENGRYFIFLYFYFLIFIISKYQFMNYCDKIIRICLIGLFDSCNSINLIMMNLIEELLETFDDAFIRYYYIISTCLLKCLCNKYSKIKIKCLDILIKLIKNNKNSKNYKIIEMLIGYKDPNIVPIKSFYDSNYVNINYLCILFNDKNVKVRFHFYSFLFIILYEFVDSNDFIAFLLPYLFSGCFDNYKIFRLLCFLFLQLLSKKKQSDLNNDIKEEIIYELYPEWSYKTSFTLPLPLTKYYFTYYNNNFLVKENMYKIDIVFENKKKGNENIEINENKEKIIENEINKEDDKNEDKKEKCSFKEIYYDSHKKDEEYSNKYYEDLLHNLIISNDSISRILRENKIKQIDITYNECNKECKKLSSTLLNIYFKNLYKKKDETTIYENFESSKIILLIFYFIEENITEHIPPFISYLIHSFEKKIDEELLCIYINCLYLIGSYVNPSNYYFFLENYLKNKKEKNITLTCLFMANTIFTGTIETYKDIKQKKSIENKIHDNFIYIIKKIISLFFFILNDEEYLEKYILILQIIYTIISNECVYLRLDEINIIYLIILLFIIFKKTNNIREIMTKQKDTICIDKNCYISLDIFDVHFYINRIKKLKYFESLGFNKEKINIKISSNIIYEIFKLSDDNINHQKLILELLSDELLYNTKFVYFLIQYIIKRQTFFYDKNFCLFLSNVIVKILNLNQRKKNLMKIIIYNESLDLYDIYQETKKKNKNKIKQVFLEYVSIIFLLFIFKNINIYENFSNTIESCKILLHILIQIKNPYSFLFFIKHTNLVNKLYDIIECREIKSIYFYKYINNDIHLNYEKYINNDGDFRYLDNINIKHKINIKNIINDEINTIFYLLSCCIYIIYYKSLCCLSILLKQNKENKEELKINEIFTKFFENAEKRLLNVLKINEKNNYYFSNSYKLTIKDILKNKDFSELFLIRNKILNSTDYNNLILNIHIYFRYSNNFLQSVNIFLLNPIILNYFYEVNKEKYLIYSSRDASIKNDSESYENNKESKDEDEKENNNLEEKIESFFNTDKFDDDICTKYDHTHLLSYFKNHDMVLFILKHDIYHIPFRLLEKDTIVILLYCCLLFFIDNFFIFEIQEIDNCTLSKLNIGISDSFFLNRGKYNADQLTALFNFLILLYLENEDILRSSLIKKQNYNNLKLINDFDNNIFLKIFNNLIINFENKNMNKESFSECLNFFLYILSINYKGALLDLKDVYTRTKHVKRMEICNHIINTFL
ncbi:conserved Plasmodium protein, unknown function [Plasmodium relictum]|uniref:Uncharacterized protein n=1 Tax=Plasmodium relictum TaxID=85471 RepID=A0A1J1H7C9_PLARL|nr:conserved Plasmodium protein, unknown function [Plasmodium relictum]CRH00453.1 conserved Plasmodium protein, unknown function [Plasmodium relictum]